MNYIDFDNSFDIINSIVDSTNKLVPLLKMNLVINETIYNTTEQIFLFLKKALLVLPDFLIIDKNLDNLRNEMIIIFDKVIESWKNYTTNPDFFFNSWENFFLTWEIFSKSIKKLNSDNNIVYISMN